MKLILGFNRQVFKSVQTCLILITLLLIVQPRTYRKNITGKVGKKQNNFNEKIMQLEKIL